MKNFQFHLIYDHRWHGRRLEAQEGPESTCRVHHTECKEGSSCAHVVWVCRQETKPWLTELPKKDNTCS